MNVKPQLWLLSDFNIKRAPTQGRCGRNIHSIILIIQPAVAGELSIDWLDKRGAELTAARHWKLRIFDLILPFLALADTSSWWIGGWLGVLLESWARRAAQKTHEHNRNFF